MDPSQIVVVVTFIVAFVASFPTVRISKKREGIYGGLVAELFHHLGVVAYLAVLPGALLGSFLVGPFKFGIPFAFLCLALTLLCFAVYAIVESPSRVGLVIEDHGWTEDDARSSGL